MKCLGQKKTKHVDKFFINFTKYTQSYIFCLVKKCWYFLNKFYKKQDINLSTQNINFIFKDLKKKIQKT